MPTVTTGAAESGATTTRKPLPRILFSIAICGPFTLASPYSLMLFLLRFAKYPTLLACVPDFAKAHAPRDGLAVHRLFALHPGLCGAPLDAWQSRKNRHGRVGQSKRHAGLPFQNYRAPAASTEATHGRHCDA